MTNFQSKLSVDWAIRFNLKRYKTKSIKISTQDIGGPADMKKSKSKDGSGGDNEQDDSGEEDHTEVRSDVSDMESHRSC